MPQVYTHISNLAAQVDIPADGILSRTLYDDGQLKVVIFAFDVGQELSEHTAAVPAILEIIEGEAQLTLGEDAVAAASGTWVHLAARLPHSVYAKTPVRMLLTMLKAPKNGKAKSQ